MTLREIVDAVLEEVGYSSSASQDVRVRVRRRVNEWHRRLLSTPTLTRLLRESYSVTFESVAGTAVYGVPPSVSRINGIYETTNQVKLAQRSLDWARATDPGASDAGVPEAYIPMGYSAVQMQPSDESDLYVVSSSDSDVSVTATVQTLAASGVQTTSSVTLVGTTAVVIAADVVEVVNFTVSPGAVGTVALVEDSGSGAVLATIPAGETAVRYLTVRLWPTPQGVVTYRVDATRENVDLVDENEEPLLPRDFHYLLVLGATSDEWRMRDDSRYEAARLDMEQGKRDLNNWIWNNVDYRPSGGPTARPSRLGAWFPAGS